MKIKKIYQGELPENKILNAQSTSQTDTYSCDYINSALSNKTGRLVKLSGTISESGTFTLNDYVSNYDFIVIGTTYNNYGHYQYLNFYNMNMNELYSWRAQRVIYTTEANQFVSSTGLKLYDNIADTTGLADIGNPLKLWSIYGVKLG